MLSSLLPPGIALATRANVDPHVTTIAVAQRIVLAARGLASLTLLPWLLPPWSVLASAVADPHLAFIAPSSCQMRSVR